MGSGGRLGGGLVGALCLALLSCSSSGAGGEGAGGSDGGGGAAGAGAGGGPSCDVHAGATPSFQRRTAEVGLGDVRGNRLMAVDLDGDTFPDLIVHRVTSNLREDPPGAPPAAYRVLMNRAASGGGRRFVEATLESGYGTPRQGTGLRSAQLAVAADVDGDGDLDLFSGTYTDAARVGTPPTPGDLDHSELLLNDGRGRFTLGPLLPEGTRGITTSGASFADVNGDGHVDLFVVGWYTYPALSIDATQPRLLIGNGDGSFRDGTAEAGLLGDNTGHREGRNLRPAYGATACDVDRDGDQDLLISAYGRQWNQLWLNDGAGRFRDEGRSTGFAGDAEEDYSDNQMFLCACRAGATDTACAGAPAPSIDCSRTRFDAEDREPWRNAGNTFTTACGDVTGDGVPDLYNAEIRHWWAGRSSDASRLLVGNVEGGALRYLRPSLEELGMQWPHPTADWNEGGISAALGDLDLDGRLDVLVGASDYRDQALLVFRQQPDGSFREVAAEWGLGHPCGNAVTVADFDRDGDLDVVVGSGTARDCSGIWSQPEVHYYENDASRRAYWVAVRARATPGTASNRAAVGALVSVRAGGVTQTREVGGGYGHFGLQGDLVQSFGLGACSVVEEVRVRWPGRAESESFGAGSGEQLLDLVGPR